MIKEVTTYIDQRLDENISLETISKFSGYSPFYLHRKIKNEFGMPMKQYMLKKRFEIAAWHLVFTDTPIKEIVGLLGYSDSSSFSRSFKKRMKYSPKEYRDLNFKKRNFKSNNKFHESIAYEIKTMPDKRNIIFPMRGNYFAKNIYGVWKEVIDYLDNESLNPDDFEFYGQYHDCIFLDNRTPNWRYDATIVSKADQELNNKKFFKSEMPGGKFICFKINASAFDCKLIIRRICNQLFEIEGLRLRPGTPVFKYDQITNESKLGYLSGELQIPCDIKK